MRSTAGAVDRCSPNVYAVRACRQVFLLEIFFTVCIGSANLKFKSSPVAATAVAAAATAAHFVSVVVVTGVVKGCSAASRANVCGEGNEEGEAGLVWPGV